MNKLMDAVLAPALIQIDAMMKATKNYKEQVLRNLKLPHASAYFLDKRDGPRGDARSFATMYQTTHITNLPSGLTTNIVSHFTRQEGNLAIILEASLGDELMKNAENLNITPERFTNYSDFLARQGLDITKLKEVLIFSMLPGPDFDNRIRDIYHRILDEYEVNGTHIEFCILH